MLIGVDTERMTELYQKYGSTLLIGIRTSFLMAVLLVVTGRASEASEFPGRVIDSYSSATSAEFSEIRIRIFDRIVRDELIITAAVSDVRLAIDGNGWMNLAAGEETRISMTSDGMRVRAGGLDRIVRGAILSASDGATVSVQRGNSAAREYPGELEIEPRDDGQGLTVVNRVPLEVYVAAVVGSEYGLRDLEGSKAMAVVARTYAVHAIRKRGGDYHLVDNARAQVYRGVGSATPLTWQAARETQGQILTWRGSPIEAVYSSSNGGHSANNESIWNAQPYSYLRGRHDPYDSVSPDAEWEFRVRMAELNNRLSDRYGFRVSDVSLGRPAVDGRVTSAILSGYDGSKKTLTGSAFRNALVSLYGGRSLRSTYLEIEKDGEEYLFSGKGYGHGVGLSQWGAHGMALKGKGYRDILSFYYTDTRLEKYETDPESAEAYSAFPLLTGASGAPDSSVQEVVSASESASASDSMPADEGIPSETIADASVPETKQSSAKRPDTARTVNASSKKAKGWAGKERTEVGRPTAKRIGW